MLAALRHARLSILAIGLTYLVSVVVGIVIVHKGSQFALSYRDRLVHRASKSDPAARALRERRRTTAALVDFSRNLFLGAAPQTISGLTILPPFALAAYRGWVGGIVSVDSKHQSRLADSRERSYYLSVLLLQLLPYTLTGGAGIHLGLASFREWRASGFRSSWTLPLPRPALADVLWIYALAVPLFLLASCVEFFAH
jgi:hypothetical protein